jgi:hypothetical protein
VIGEGTRRRASALLMPLSIRVRGKRYLRSSRLGTRRSAFPVVMWGATGAVSEARRVGIYYHALGRTDTGGDGPERHEMLFFLQDSPNGFGPAVERWPARAKALDPVYQLYLETVYNPQMFQEQRFLNLAHALEVYHRRTTTILDLPEGHVTSPFGGTSGAGWTPSRAT